MKLLLSDLNNKTKLFLGDLDSYTIIKKGFSKDFLMEKIKLGLLLYDKIMVPAAFFWQTDQMAKLLLEVEPLIASGYILPVIRAYNETPDVISYFNRREQETSHLLYTSAMHNPELSSEIATISNYDQVITLKDLHTTVNIDGESVKNIFIRLWNKDLDNFYEINSICNIIDNSIIDNSIIDLTERNNYFNIFRDLSKMYNFSRASLVNAIESLNLPKYTNIREKLINRISWLYLKASSKANKSSFYISDPLYRNEIKRSNLMLYSSTLNIFGINRKFIKNIDCKELCILKQSDEFFRFIQNYIKLISEMELKHTSTKKDIIKKLEIKLHEDLLKKGIWITLNKVQQISSSIFWELIVNCLSGSKVSKIAIASSLGATLISTILNKLDAVNNYLESRSFLDFKTYIINKQYNEKVCKITGRDLLS